MCNRCDEIDVKVGQLRTLAAKMLDQQTLDGIDRLVSELEAQKSFLHPDKAGDP